MEATEATESTVITPEQVLLGHTSPETAYLIEDYPYGRTLRCQKRMWIEHGTIGDMKQQVRVVGQTNNPKVAGKPWNKPKTSNYYDFAIIYLDAIDHVHVAALTFYDSPQDFARFEPLVAELDDATKALFAQAKQRARGASPRAWQKAEQAS